MALGTCWGACMALVGGYALGAWRIKTCQMGLNLWCLQLVARPTGIYHSIYDTACTSITHVLYP